MTQYDPSSYGVEIDLDAITIPRAREFTRFLREDNSGSSNLLSVRRFRKSASELVVLEAKVSVPQRPVHDIKSVEIIGALFPTDDQTQPEVVSFRSDFPLVPHTNLRPKRYPISLCLYSQPWHETKAFWTPSHFLSRIVWWLEETAHGSLHQDDQPLEPLLFESYSDLIVPGHFLNTSSPAIPYWASCRRVHRAYNTYSLHLEKTTNPLLDDASEKCFVLVMTSKPVTHGLVRYTPRTLKELDNLVSEADINVRQQLVSRLRRTRSQYKVDDLERVLQAKLVVILRLRKRRLDRGAVETVEIRAFESSDSLKLVGEKIGINWNIANTTNRPQLPNSTRDGAAVNLNLLNVREAFSRELAAQVSGYEQTDHTPEVVAIGLGALGSQVVTNLTRSGYGRWALVDYDVLQPHNLGRHALGPDSVGLYKSEALSSYLGKLIDEPEAFTPFVANVLIPGAAAGGLDPKLKSANLILDMAASVPVSRHLVRDVDSDSRRASLFLNPSGNALTLLAEDADRRIPLDALEMQFYRRIVADPKIHELLAYTDNTRTGLSCRDVSARITQDSVAIHSGAGSRAVRLLDEIDDALVRTWLLDDQGNYSLVMDFNGAQIQQIQEDGWTIFIDSDLVDKLAEFRGKRLPNETGGVLLGTHDNDRKLIYLADALPSPPDSKERRTSYIRGVEGLEESVRLVNRITDNMLGYVGEWHSHPAGSGVAPSSLDMKLLGWVSEGMSMHGEPGLILVVGDERQLKIRIQE